MPAKRKPVVFISHITEEKEIALALQQLVQRSFLQAVELFVSSDEKSIPMGKEWLPTIKDHLLNCVFEIVVASPESIGRAWIGFEAGAVWIRDKPVIALCHSGIAKDKLPPPLGHLQGADATNETDLKRIFADLAVQLDMTCPNVDFTDFISLVESFEGISKENATLIEHALLPPKSGLAAIEVAALKTIASFPDALIGSIAIQFIIPEMCNAGFHASAASTAVSMLSRKGFVEVTKGTYNFHECIYVLITSKGWEWLESNHDAVDFTLPPPSIGSPTPPF